HYPKMLSGGMQQRTALARALANDPKILLLDEPFGALDNQTRALMQELLLGIWEADRKTVLFVTHDIDEAIFMANCVAVLSAGAVDLKAAIGGVDDHALRPLISGWKRDGRAPAPDHGGAVVWMPTLSTEAHPSLYTRREMPEAWGVKGKSSSFVPTGRG